MDYFTEHSTELALGRNIFQVTAHFSEKSNIKLEDLVEAIIKDRAIRTIARKGNEI